MWNVACKIEKLPNHRRLYNDIRAGHRYWKGEFNCASHGTAFRIQPTSASGSFRAPRRPSSTPNVHY